MIITVVERLNEIAAPPCGKAAIFWNLFRTAQSEGVLR